MVRCSASKGLAARIFTGMSLPFGAVYDVESPTLWPLIDAPSGEVGENTSMSAVPAISREPSRKVISSPATSAVTTMPCSTTPSSGGVPICTLRSLAFSSRMRASCFACSSRAAW